MVISKKDTKKVFMKKSKKEQKEIKNLRWFALGVLVVFLVGGYVMSSNSNNDLDKDLHYYSRYHQH